MILIWGKILIKKTLYRAFLLMELRKQKENSRIFGKKKKKKGNSFFSIRGHWMRLTQIYFDGSPFL